MKCKTCGHEYHYDEGWQYDGYCSYSCATKEPLWTRICTDAYYEPDELVAEIKRLRETCTCVMCKMHNP